MARSGATRDRAGDRRRDHVAPRRPRRSQHRGAVRRRRRRDRRRPPARPATRPVRDPRQRRRPRRPDRRRPRHQLLAMDGHETFKQAVRRLGEASIAAAQAAGLPLGELDLYVYHQANTRILASLAERLALDPAKVVDAIAAVGNTSAASVPLALEQARREGRLRPGMRACCWRPSAPASPGARASSSGGRRERDPTARALRAGHRRLARDRRRDRPRAGRRRLARRDQLPAPERLGRARSWRRSRRAAAVPSPSRATSPSPSAGDAVRSRRAGASAAGARARQQRRRARRTGSRCR